MHFENCGSLCAPVLGLLVSLGIDAELGQDILDTTLVLDGQKASLGLLIQGQILVSVSITWWLSASSAFLRGTGTLPVIFWHVVDPLAFYRTVFLTPQIFLSILGFISHSTFWLLQNPVWEVLDVGWISLSLLTVACVEFIR